MLFVIGSFENFRLNEKTNAYSHVCVCMCVNVYTNLFAKKVTNNDTKSTDGRGGDGESGGVELAC